MAYWPDHERPRMQAGQPQAWRQMGLNELLLDNRIIFLDLPLDPHITINSSTVCSHVIKSMLYLQSIKRDQDIHLYINCPGGDIDDTRAIYDTMRFLNCEVATYCVGGAASGAALILAAGTRGKRYALPHAKIMLHQPAGEVGGQAADIAIAAKEVLRDKETLIRIVAGHTGQDPEKIRRETERDRYFTAEEAKAWGLVDEVLAQTPDANKPK